MATMAVIVHRRARKRRREDHKTIKNIFMENYRIIFGKSYLSLKNLSGLGVLRLAVLLLMIY
jgi:hypothetical protein